MSSGAIGSTIFFALVQGSAVIYLRCPDQPRKLDIDLAFSTNLARRCDLGDVFE